MATLESYVGKTVTLFCANYIYTGTLVSVNDFNLTLDGTDAAIVYETGELTAKAFKDAQALGGDWNVVRSAIEGFGAGKGSGTGRVDRA
jgi:hypothetical protein